MSILVYQSYSINMSESTNTNPLKIDISSLSFNDDFNDDDLSPSPVKTTNLYDDNYNYNPLDWDLSFTLNTYSNSDGVCYYSNLFECFHCNSILNLHEREHDNPNLCGKCFNSEIECVSCSQTIVLSNARFTYEETFMCDDCASQYVTCYQCRSDCTQDQIVNGWCYMCART